MGIQGEKKKDAPLKKIMKNRVPLFCTIQNYVLFFDIENWEVGERLGGKIAVYYDSKLFYISNGFVWEKGEFDKKKEIKQNYLIFAYDTVWTPEDPISNREFFKIKKSAATIRDFVRTKKVSTGVSTQSK